MNEEPLYLKIFNIIYEGIVEGKYAPGDRLPSEKQIADEFNVSRITSKKAFLMLVEKNLIKRIPGKGSFVLSSSERKQVENGVPPRKKSKILMIGLVISDYAESYGLNLLNGIEKEISKRECVVITKRSFGSQELEDESIDMLIDVGIDGLLIMPVHGEHYNPKILKLILGGFPVVFVDRNLKGISASFVGTDNVNATKEATNYLLDAGHRYISFLSPPFKDTTTIEDRIGGFIKSHAEYGVAVDESVWQTSLTSTMPGHNGKENIEKDVERIEELLKNKPQITCFFAAEYNLALIAAEAVKRAGLRIPDDISILCFDGPVNVIGEDFFTHIRQKEQEMGLIAVRLLLDQISGKKECRKVFLDTDLVIGKSTRGIDSQDLS